MPPKDVLPRPSTSFAAFMTSIEVRLTPDEQAELDAWRDHFRAEARRLRGDDDGQEGALCPNR